MLAPHVKGRLFTSLDEVTESYDLVLVPEVMEHVPNVSDFLAQLQAIDAATFLISVPDAFQCRGRHFDYLADSATFVEVVHPDHNVWYTPYTFANTIRKYSALQHREDVVLQQDFAARLAVEGRDAPCGLSLLGFSFGRPIAKGARHFSGRVLDGEGRTSRDARARWSSCCPTPCSA